MKKKHILFTGFLLCLVLSALFLFIGFKPFFVKQPIENFAPTRPATNQGEPDKEAPSDDKGDKEESDTLKCPVDFRSLNKINSDIYAWIDIPGTNISYPVLQSNDDDAFYLNHDSYKDYSFSGSIFSEKKYNSKTLDDPVTILYGHDMLSGDMFGQLQSCYSSEEFLKKNNKILIYTQDKELQYEIFAATPYYRLHLLHYFNFDESYVFNQFFDELYNYRTISSTFTKDKKPFYGDKVVVLSTCMNNGDNQRFLVFGVLKSEKKYT